ncbi:MAG: ABC transporter permease [Cyanobacteria bacterium NC_groundwater_1444_Ag_S-0.65um_54_12]|nr:ABC transporter permease [Cyanobacteria bacterium NC_groundwater_1444_Ag_S-0.65um_54_12]
MVLRRFLKHKLAVASVVVLLLLVLSSIFGPYFLPRYDAIDLSNTNQFFPSLKHLLGTDELGQDVLARLLYAGRISLFVGLTAAILDIVIGTIVGALSGYHGKTVDMIGMRLADMFLCVPLLMLLLVLSSFTRGRTFVPFLSADLQQLVVIVVIIGATSWMGAARLVRGEFLSLREQEFIEAAKAAGGKAFWIISRHMVPNAMAPIFVAATLKVADAILLESALSFLGMGIQPPVPSWGNMLTNAQQYMIATPWLAVYPGLMIFLTVVSINFIGDGLRDALDPKLKH